MRLITQEQALTAVTQSEFGDDIVRSAECVAVVLTQSWCPQWHAMKRFVTDFAGADVYCLEYDRVDYFEAFREFKERVLGNEQIPYIRYYCRGSLITESNAVSEETFRQKLFTHP